MRYQQQPRKSHRRNLFDTLRRRFKSSYKHKVIRKENYTGEWPFYTIDGYDYALNGSAKSRFKLENPHDAGQAILGKGTADFIRMALDLDERNAVK